MAPTLTEARTAVGAAAKLALMAPTRVSRTDPARRMAGVALRARSIRENPAYSSNRPPRYLARKRSASA